MGRGDLVLAVFLKCDRELPDDTGSCPTSSVSSTPKPLSLCPRDDRGCGLLADDFLARLVAA
jgi:hypothetical protein